MLFPVPPAPLRLMLFDATRRDALTATWRVGGPLFRKLGWLDQHRGVSGWEEGLRWLAETEPGRTIAAIQYWGHGRWGRALIGDESLDASATREGHPLHPLLLRIRERLEPDAAWWFRTCETFGAQPGHEFARAWSRFFRVRAAGFTHVIGPWQSGLHVLAPGAEPDWPASEGLPAGVDPAAPHGTALWSRPGIPNTVSCFAGRLRLSG